MLPRRELVDALLDAFDAITFDRMLSDFLSIDRERMTAAVGLAGLDAIVSKVVEIADECRFAIELIRAATAANPGNLKLQQFVARYPAYDPDKQPNPQSVFLSVFMRGRRVFFGREQLRQQLGLIGGPNQSRVLAIDGSRFAGKTYSWDFLIYLRENEPGWAGRQHRVIYINLDDCVFEPEDLARVIGRKLGLDVAAMPVDKGEQAPRRNPDLLDWISRGFADTSVDVWWVILDGFRVQVQPAATHDLIRLLIDAAEHDQEKLRVILLNYKEHLDPDNVYILTEEIQPFDEQKDLPRFFRHVYTLSKRPFGDHDITRSVNQVRQQVDAEVAKRGPEWRMKLLSIGLTKAANELLK